jgi:hypothetical protein
VEDYRLYCIDEANHFVGCDEIEAESDEAAVLRSITLQGAHAAELWCGARKIGTFEPRPAEQDADKPAPVQTPS